MVWTGYGNFEQFSWCFVAASKNTIRKQRYKKRPNTIPVFGPGKWLLGESRALKVGINAG
ncbi:hypothetical protein FDX19_03305 [Citrobacter sp. wls619]|nr:hypothetical protein FDX19_03305 [Citrobacter sp. wls619]